jgi:hypothetical protein
MKKLFVILFVILLASCSSKTTHETEVIGLIYSPGLKMIVDDRGVEHLEGYAVVTLTTFITRDSFKVITDAEFVTAIGPLLSTEDPNDYRPGTKLKEGVLYGVKGLYPEWKMDGK